VSYVLSEYLTIDFAPAGWVLGCACAAVLSLRISVAYARRRVIRRTREAIGRALEASDDQQ